MKLDYAFKTFLDPVSTDVHSSSFHEAEARWQLSRMLQIRGRRRFVEPDIWLSGRAAWRSRGVVTRLDTLDARWYTCIPNFTMIGERFKVRAIGGLCGRHESRVDKALESVMNKMNNGSCTPPCRGWRPQVESFGPKAWSSERCHAACEVVKLWSWVGFDNELLDGWGCVGRLWCCRWTSWTCPDSDGRPRIRGWPMVMRWSWQMLEYKQGNSGWWQSSKGAALDDD